MWFVLQEVTEKKHIAAFAQVDSMQLRPRRRRMIGIEDHLQEADGDLLISMRSCHDEAMRRLIES